MTGRGYLLYVAHGARELALAVGRLLLVLAVALGKLALGPLALLGWVLERAGRPPSDRAECFAHGHDETKIGPYEYECDRCGRKRSNYGGGRL